LASKSEELAAVQALPKENPQLLVKIQELENINSGLLGQVNTANGDAAKAKEELKSIQETSASNTEQIRTLEGKLEGAQIRIGGFEEEKKKIQAAAIEEIKKKGQEIAKMADFTKTNMQTMYESKLKNLKQKCSEQETELKSTKESLQRTQDEGASSATNPERLLAELASYKEQFVLQAAALKRLEGQQFGLQDRGKQVDSDLGSVGRHLEELQGHLETTRNATGQDLEEIFKAQEEIEGNLRKLDSLQQEKVEYQEKNNELQKKLETAEKGNREKEALEMAKHALEEEVATLRKQLKSATNSKVEILEKEKNMLAKQNSNLQAQVDSLNQSRHLAKNVDGSTNRIKSIHRETPQQMQTSTFQQMSPSHPGYEEACRADEEILRGHMPSPKKMFRDAMKENNFTSNPRVGNGSLSNAPTSVPETQFDSQPRAYNSRLRRASTRRSSNPYQSQQSETTLANTTETSSMTKLPSKLEEASEPSRRASTRRPSHRRQSGQSDDGDMLLTPNMTAYPQFCAPAVRTSGITRTSSVSVGNSSAIKQFSAFSPVGQSPLTDLQPMIDQLESVNTQKQLNEEYRKTRDSKPTVPKNDVPDPEVNAARAERVIPDSQDLGRGPPYERNYIPLSQQFSDVEATPRPRKTRANALTAEEESTRRRSSVPLKSALKNPQPTPISNPHDTHTASEVKKSSYFQTPASTSVLQDKSSGVGTNKKQTQPSTTRGYNRVASGISAKSRVGSSGNTRRATASSHPGSKYPAKGQHDSPLPGVPARNRKRSFEGKDGPEKPSKVSRVSLPHQASNRVVPDSQEGQRR
jgi:myosin heavy subunit